LALSSLRFFVAKNRAPEWDHGMGSGMTNGVSVEFGLPTIPYSIRRVGPSSGLRPPSPIRWEKENIFGCHTRGGCLRTATIRLPRANIRQPFRLKTSTGRHEATLRGEKEFWETESPRTGRPEVCPTFALLQRQGSAETTRVPSRPRARRLQSAIGNRQSAIPRT